MFLKNNTQLLQSKMSDDVTVCRLQTTSLSVDYSLGQTCINNYFSRKSDYQVRQ